MALSVHEAVALALERGIELQTSHIDFSASAIQREMARRQFLPSMAATAARTRKQEAGNRAGMVSEAGFAGSWKLRNGLLLSGSYSRNGSGQASTQSAGIAVPLWRDAGREINTIDEKNTASALRLMESTLSQTRQDTILQCVRAYFGLELARMKADVAREATARAQEIARLNTALVKAGRVARITVSQNELTIAQAQVNLAQAEQEVQVAERAFLKAIGNPAALLAETQIGLKDSFTDQILPVPVSLSETLQEAAAQRHDLYAKREELLMARLAVKKARNDGLPRLDLKFEVSQQRNRLGDLPGSFPDGGTGSLDQNRSRSIGLTLQVPLDRTELRMASDIAVLGQKKAELQLASLERDVSAEITEAFNAHRFLRKQVGLAKAAVDLARLQLDAEVLKVKAGRSSAADSAAAQDALRQAELQLIQARFDLFNAALTLQRSLGTLASTWTASPPAQP